MKTTTYDKFMPLAYQERISLFNEVSFENRALLVRTHIERFLIANRKRFNADQIDLLEEAIRSISPEKYDYDPDNLTEEVIKSRRETEELRKRGETLFSREDVIEIFSNRGSYIPLR